MFRYFPYFPAALALQQEYLGTRLLDQHFAHLDTPFIQLLEVTYVSAFVSWQVECVGGNHLSVWVLT